MVESKTTLQTLRARFARNYAAAKTMLRKEQEKAQPSEYNLGFFEGKADAYRIALHGLNEIEENLG